MRKGNAAIFLLIVSVVSVAITSYLAQQQISIRRAGAVGGATPIGQILSMPTTAKVGETVEISAQVSDIDKDLADPFSVFSNVIKLYYSKSVSPTNPNEWTEIPGSQAAYQCYSDANADFCKIFARWTPTSTGKYTFIVTGFDKAGNKCSGNPYFNYAGQTDWKRCGTNNEDWREITVTASPPVAGHVRDQDGKGIPNVDVGIYPQGVKEYIIKTDANGYFSLDTTDLPAGRLYTVRAQPDAPPGHIAPVKTTNITHSLNTATNTNTALGSTSYENQKVSQGDCGKVDVSGVGCDFEYEKLPVPSNTPTPTPTPTVIPKTYSLTVSPSASLNLAVNQTEDVSVTLKENGQPVQDLSPFTFFWAVQDNNGIIQVTSSSQINKNIKGLKNGQVTIIVSVNNADGNKVAQTTILVLVASPTNTPTPTKTPTPTLTNTPTPSVTPTMSPTPSITGTISPTETGCRKQKGDANCDGLTNIQDFAIWRQEYLGGCTSRNGTFKACGEDRDGDTHPIDADFSGDGKVTLIDFAIWRTDFK